MPSLSKGTLKTWPEFPVNCYGRSDDALRHLIDLHSAPSAFSAVNQSGIMTVPWSRGNGRSGLLPDTQAHVLVLMAGSTSYLVFIV